MKLNKIILLGFVLSLLPAVSAFSQLIRYVSYYPVPAVTHSQLSVTGKTVLGGIGNANIEIGSEGVASGTVVGQSFQANRLVLTSFNNSASSQNLIVGHIANNNTSNAGILKAGANVSVVENLPALSTIEATGNLSIAGLYWPGKGGIGLNKDGTEDWENCPEGSELNWIRLRLGGSDDFKTYLVCGAPDVKEAPQCDPAVYQCKATEDLLGNPVMGTCRCVEDCKKRTDGKTQLTEGGICCKPGQIAKDGPYGKFCTFVFNQSYEWVTAIASTTSYKGNSPSTQTCGDLSHNGCDAQPGYTCKPNTSTIKYYRGGSVKREGGGDLGNCGTKTCGRCYRRNDAHNAGWTGGTQITTVCPTVTAGQAVCDLLCDGDVKSCNKSCYPKTPPTLPNGTRYYYAACRNSGKCALVKTDCKFDVKAWYCGYTYTTVQITKCSGT